VANEPTLRQFPAARGKVTWTHTWCFRPGQESMAISRVVTPLRAGRDLMHCAGNKPAVLTLCPSAARGMRTGDEVRVSTPVMTASSYSEATDALVERGHVRMQFS
jgi:hypothetical protein